MAGERAKLSSPILPTDAPSRITCRARARYGIELRHGCGTGKPARARHDILRPAFRNVAAHCQAGAIAFVCFRLARRAAHARRRRGVFDDVKNWMVWVKTNAGMGTFYRSQFELILAFRVSPGSVINNFGLGEGGRHRSNVWTYAGANTFRAGRAEDSSTIPR